VFMKFGISTYSLFQAYSSGELTLEGVIGTIAELGADHAEIVPIGYNLVDEPHLIDVILHAAQVHGLELSSYAISANFSGLTDEAFEEELQRVKREVDVCSKLGIKRMRHDIAGSADVSIQHFLEELPRLIKACEEIADYAKPFNITTSIENHGFYVQHSDRIQAIVHGVNRDNFRTTVDIGNFLCVDEQPEVAVAKNIGLASMVHLKDFYIRPSTYSLDEGWFRSSGGILLRGAILGQGDINLPYVLKLIKESGYDGYISLEFEGLEECKLGTRLGFDYLKRVWQTI
jgi:sugar phosphate isomerase/epimerase